MENATCDSSKPYIANGSIDLDTDMIKVMLVTSAYSPDQDAHNKRDDISNEASGTGYTSEGQALANESVAADNADNEGVLDADDVTWTNSAVTAKGTVLLNFLASPNHTTN